MQVDLRVPVGLPLPELADFVAGCEDAGFAGVGIHDHPHSGRDVYVALALAAQRTRRLRLYPATLDLQAVARMAVRADSGAGALRLDFDRGMDVRSVRVDGRPAAHRRRGDALLVRLPDAGREQVVEVAYAGRPAVGLYAGPAGGQRVVFTDSWPQRGAGFRLPALRYDLGIGIAED